MLVVRQWRRELVVGTVVVSALGVVMLVASLAPWRAFVPVKMRAATPPPPTFATEGTWHGRDGYHVEGQVALAAAGGTNDVWLRSYSAEGLHSPRLLLSALPAAAITAARPVGALDIGGIPGTDGEVSFPLPAGVDSSQLHAAIVYDRGVDRVVAVAALGTPLMVTPDKN